MSHKTTDTPIEKKVEHGYMAELYLASWLARVFLFDRNSVLVEQTSFEGLSARYCHVRSCNRVRVLAYVAADSISLCGPSLFQETIDSSNKSFKNIFQTDSPPFNRWWSV